MQELTLRPQVGMGQIMAAPYVVALGVCDALPQAGIAWPYEVIDSQTGETLCTVRAQGGYDDEGMFVRVIVPAAEGVEQAVRARVDAWAAGPAAAPLSAVLADYADSLVQLGKEVTVRYPNGAEYARGTFVGVDVWGRATVRLASGAEIEFPPEKFRVSKGA